MRLIATLVLAAAWALPALAQDSKAWLEAQGLDAVDTKGFQEFEAVVAKAKGGGEQRAIIFKQGKPAWQSTPKDTDPGSKWSIVSIGRDLAGNGQPDVHFSTNTGGATCCTTHHVYQLKPQVKRLAAYQAGSMGGGDFVEVPGRKAPVMVSADDSSANAFAPYANSYFPLLTWLKERCAEYTSMRRQARTQEMKTRLASIKSNRSADKLKWEDYFENGVLASVSAEINRYAYTGHGAAGMNWLETVWPGNDAVKAKFIATLRQTQAKSVFAEDLKSMASNYQ